MSETLTKQFNAHIGSRVSYKIQKEGYFDKTGSIIITEDGQTIDLTSTLEPYDSNLKVIYQPQAKATYTTETDYITIGEPEVSTTGIASNFNSTSWIEIDPIQKQYNTTFYIAFTTPATLSAKQSIVHATGWFTLEIDTDYTINSWNYFTSKDEEIITLDPNTKYYFKVAISSTQTKIILIFDPISKQWSEIARFLDRGINPRREISAGVPAPFRLGQKSTSTDRAFTGTIDLANTFITTNVDVNNNTTAIAYRPFNIIINSSDLICAPANTLLSGYTLPTHTNVRADEITDTIETIDNKDYAVGLTYAHRNELKADIISEENSNFLNIGAVSIKNRVASGFSPDSYLIPKDILGFEIYAAYSETWEAQFKFTYKPTTDYFNTRQVLFAQGIGYENKFGIKNGYLEISINSNAGGDSYTVASYLGPTKFIENKDYWLKVFFDGANYTAYLSEDGINYDLEILLKSKTKMNIVASDWRIGYNALTDKSVSYPFQGTIDLNACYLMADNKEVWKPYNDIDIDTLRNNCILKKGKQLNNVTKYGAVTDINGVLGNFSGTNYTKLPITFNPGSQSWEICYKVRTPDTVSGNQFYFGCLSTSGEWGILTGFYDSKFKIWLSGNGTSWNICENGGTIGVSAGTDYWIKVNYDTTNGYTYKVSKDNIYWETTYTNTSTTPIHSCSIYVGSGWDVAANYLKANGRIYSQDIKITVNGQVVWQPIYNIKNENFAVVYNLTNNNDVYSGFTTTDYLQLTKDFGTAVQSASSWEVYMKVYTGTLGVRQKLFAGGAGDNSWLGIESSKKWRVRLRAQNTTNFVWDFTGTTTISENTLYYVKLCFTGSAYELYYSLDNINWTLEGSKSSTAITGNVASIWTMGMGLTDNVSYHNPFRGNIYLKDCYIKINNQLWWSAFEPFNAYENFTKTFDIAINNKTASGFTEYDFIRLPKTLPENYSTFEFNTAFTCSEFLNTGMRLLGRIRSDMLAGIVIGTNNTDTNKLSLWLNNTNTSWNIYAGTSSYTLTLNTKYYLKFNFDGTKYTLSIRKENEEFQTIITVNSASKIVNAIPFDLGSYDVCTWKGNIYLEDTSFKVDGNIWWEPYIQTKPKYIPLTTSNENFFKTTGVHINNGIVSGLGSNNIILLNKPFLPNYSIPFEIVMKASTGTLGDIQELFAVSTYPLLFRLNGSNWQICYFVNNSYATTNIMAASANTTYWTRLYYDGSTFYIYISTTKDSWGTAKFSVSLPNFLQFFEDTPAYIGSQSNGEYWKGVIDLKECYIKINNEYWWKPFKEENAEKTIHTKYNIAYPKAKEITQEYNNYRAIGNLISDNLIYSGFSANNYINMNIGETNVKTADLIIKVKVNAFKDNCDVFGFSTYDAPIGFKNNGTLGRFNGSAWYTGTNTYPTNTWIWVRQISNDNIHSVYSIQDNNYTLDTLPNISEWELAYSWSTTIKLFAGILRIGNTWLTTSEYFNGSIDLNTFKLVINDKPFTLTSNENRQFTIVDSNNKLLVSNGLASGFSDTTDNYGYIQCIDDNFNGIFKANKPWIFQTKVLLGETTPEYQTIALFGERIQLYAYNNKKFYVWIANNNNSAIVNEKYGSWIENTWIWVRLLWTGAKYCLLTSRDGSNFEIAMDIANTHIAMPKTESNVLGATALNNSRYMGNSGLIDLKETFIWQNGKVTWSPYNNEEFIKKELEGFYTTDFEYDGQQNSVNAYEAVFTGEISKTILGNNLNNEQDLIGQSLLKRNVEIGADNEEIFTYISDDELFKPNNYCVVTFIPNITNYKLSVNANDKIYTNPNKIYVKAGTTISYTASKNHYWDLNDTLTITEDKTIDLIFSKKEFKFTIDTRNTSTGATSTDTTYILPFLSNINSFILKNTNVSINWGDNTTTFLSNTSWSTATVTHTYPKAGIYQITVASDTGYMPYFQNNYTNTNNNYYKIISLDSPLLKIANNNATNIFYYAMNLTSIHEDLFKYNPEVTNLSAAFYYCSKLQSLPENLLKPLIDLTTCPSTFAYCYGLQNIPENLFKYNTKILYLNYTFRYCTALQRIPENLLKSLSGLSEMSYTFANITRNFIIPKDLFKYNLALYRVNGIFSSSYMTTIPDDLFKYNTAINNFNYAFANCYYLTLNPNVFGDLTTRFVKFPNKNSVTIDFSYMFARRYCYVSNPGTAPELWNCTMTNANNVNITKTTAMCFGNTNGYAGYSYLNTYYGNRNVSNFWDIPATWGGLSNIELTVTVES